MAEISQPGPYNALTADGRSLAFRVPAQPAPLNIAGPWTVTFPPNLGAPPQVTLDKLISWTAHPDAGVKYFSGTAAYACQVDVSADDLKAGRKWYLDLGKVAVMAQVSLNGRGSGNSLEAAFPRRCHGRIESRPEPTRGQSGQSLD